MDVNGMNGGLNASDAMLRQQKVIFPLSFAALLMLIMIWIGANLFNADNSYWTNLFTEGISIGVTVLILDRLNEFRAEQQLKRRLIREAGSQSNETAKAAIDWMWHEGWLSGEDSLLIGSDLSRANLSGVILHNANLSKAKLPNGNMIAANLDGANLSGVEMPHAKFFGATLRETCLRGANLQHADMREASMIQVDLSEADLWQADLKKANLFEANLEKATLRMAQMEGVHLDSANLLEASLVGVKLNNAGLADSDMRGALLTNTNLSGANLTRANLEDAALRWSNLRGTILYNANLRGVGLSNMSFDENTVLPDARLIRTEQGRQRYTKYWTPETDMRRYTHSEHPDFWQPEWIRASQYPIEVYSFKRNKRLV